MGGEGSMRSRKLQHGRRNRIVSLPKTSLSAGFAVERRYVSRVIKMGVVGHHVYRASSGKAQILLSFSLLPLDLLPLGIPIGSLNITLCCGIPDRKSVV